MNEPIQDHDNIVGDTNGTVADANAESALHTVIRDDVQVEGEANYEVATHTIVEQNVENQVLSSEKSRVEEIETTCQEESIADVHNGRLQHDSIAHVSNDEEIGEIQKEAEQHCHDQVAEELQDQEVDQSLRIEDEDQEEEEAEMIKILLEQRVQSAEMDVYVKNAHVVDHHEDDGHMHDKANQDDSQNGFMKLDDHMHELEDQVNMYEGERIDEQQEAAAATDIPHASVGVASNMLAVTASTGDGGGGVDAVDEEKDENEEEEEGKNKKKSKKKKDRSSANHTGVGGSSAAAAAAGVAVVNGVGTGVGTNPSEGKDNRFSKLANCHMCKRKNKYVYGCYKNWVPTSCNKFFCLDCLLNGLKENILLIVQKNETWKCPYKQGTCQCRHCLNKKEDFVIPPIATEEVQKLFGEVPSKKFKSNSHSHSSSGNGSNGNGTCSNGVVEDPAIARALMKAKFRRLIDFNGQLLQKMHKLIAQMSKQEVHFYNDLIHENLTVLDSLATTLTFAGLLKEEDHGAYAAATASANAMSSLSMTTGSKLYYNHQHHH